jgi:large subunit ribosomal protein L13
LTKPRAQVETALHYGRRSNSSPPTYQAKEPFARSWYIADVDGLTLGRAATKIADVLRGKHRPTFTTHADAGDFVVVVNAEKVRLTGKKWSGKLYRDHSLFPAACGRRRPSSWSSATRPTW